MTPEYTDDQTHVFLCDWEDALAHLPEVDSLICDAPYSTRTLVGYRTSRKVEGDSSPHAGAEFRGWDEAEVHAFVRAFEPKVRAWWFVMASHDQIPWYESAFARAGLYVFAPVSIVSPASPRFAGDGPCSQTVYGMVARPRQKRFLGWGSLPGNYTTHERGSGSGRGKPYSLMLQIVEHYSREGETVLDPCAGYGVTGRAAKDLRRNVVLVERDTEVGLEAIEAMRPRRRWQQERLFAGAP